MRKIILFDNFFYTLVFLLFSIQFLYCIEPQKTFSLSSIDKFETKSDADTAFIYLDLESEINEQYLIKLKYLSPWQNDICN